jgi:hypothetical protein
LRCKMIQWVVKDDMDIHRLTSKSLLPSWF